MIFHNGVLIASRCLKVCRPLLSTARSVVSTLRCGGEVEASRRHADGATGGLPWVDVFVTFETRTSDLFLHIGQSAVTCVESRISYIGR